LVADGLDVGFAGLNELVDSADDEGYVHGVVDVAGEEQHVNAKLPRTKPSARARINNNILNEFTR